MGVEIERKFLVVNDDWRQLVSLPKLHIMQGYLCLDPERTVRVRLENTGRRQPSAKLTIKGKTDGFSRKEFEYSIPHNEAVAMWSLCVGAPIIKTRCRVPASDDLVWEIDVFEGRNQGLIVAEIELPEEDTKIELPDWIGDEVSDDYRYFNSNLVNAPYRDW